VDVQMIPQGSIPGMQHPDHPDRAAEATAVAGKGLQGVGRGLEEQGIDQFLMRAASGLRVCGSVQVTRK